MLDPVYYFTYFVLKLLHFGYCSRFLLALFHFDIPSVILFRESHFLFSDAGKY